MMTALFEGITLTDAERKSIDSIRTSYQSQMQQARSSGDRSQMRDLMQKQTGDFRNVLTPDQQTTFDKNLATLRSRRQGMGGGGTPPSGGTPQ
jgi:Spy/CpxP family protein refolding chaperone